MSAQRSCSWTLAALTLVALAALASAADSAPDAADARSEDTAVLVQTQLQKPATHAKHAAKTSSHHRRSTHRGNLPNSSLARHKRKHKQSIVIRDDVDDGQYQGNPGDYPAVFPLDTYSFDASVGECAATLIDATHAITAAHCMPQNGKQIPVRIAGKRYKVVQAFPHPCFDYSSEGPDGADVAVITLNKAVPAGDASPVPIYEWNDEAGKQFELVGWGETGSAGQSSEDTTFDESFRVAENVVTQTANGMVLYKFDSGDSGGLPHEGVAWSGDSGGPAFISVNGVRYIAGVSSAGDCCQYGDQDGYAQLSDKRDWILATIEQGTVQDASCAGLGDAPES